MALEEGEQDVDLVLRRCHDVALAQPLRRRKLGVLVDRNVHRICQTEPSQILDRPGQKDQLILNYIQCGGWVTLPNLA